VTPDEFATASRLYCQELGGSVTSWGRTEKHSIAVGGFAGDPHTRWTGLDVVYDTPQPLALRYATAAKHGLQLIPEKDHDHLQDHK
jgi:hypothetical protein